MSIEMKRAPDGPVSRSQGAVRAQDVKLSEAVPKRRHMSWAEARRRRIPPKTCTAAILLFTAGTLLIIFGMRLYYNGDRDRAISTLTIGSLCFLPGSYASWILFGAWNRWPGYEYHQVPSYDD